jgi:hypothetical protein
MPTAGRAANSCPRTGPEQAAANCALARIVRVRTPGQPQDEGRRDDAGSDQSLHHVFLVEKLGAITGWTQK